MSEDLRDASSDVEFFLEGNSCDPLSKYKSEDDEWNGGVRPLNVVESHEDLIELLARSESKKPRAVCGYCGKTSQIRNLSEGDRWFRSHECAGDGEVIKIEEAA